MRRNRRRKKFAWFPILGAADPTDGNDDLNGRVFSVPWDGSGTSNAIIFPLVPDVQQEAEQIQPDLPGQLVEGLGQDYLIERIVGKVFVAASSAADDQETFFPKTVQVACGFFVARQADDNTGGGPNLPIGAASLAEVLENYSPLNDDNVRRPWMWQRNWILTTGRPNPNLATDVTAFNSVYTNIPSGVGFTTPVGRGIPVCNMEYGSIQDGPHVDIKTSRRVRSDERLWFIAAARSLDRILDNVNPTVGVQSSLKGLVQIRVLGALRRPNNRSNF